jgi:adhesin/invasin
LNPGTEVRFSVNRGSIEAIGLTDETGRATARFTADGRQGAATVTATTGAGTTSVTTDIQVGQTADSKPVLLVSANPSNVPVGGTSTITILARNPDGSNVAEGTSVFLTTTLGTLNPASPRIGPNGTTTSRLNVGTQSGNAEVTAVVGSSDPTRATVTIRNAAASISLQPVPATLSPQGGDVELQVFVADAQGLALQGAPVTFQTDLGTLDSTVSQTNSQGLATVTLTVTEQEIGSKTEFDVRASTPKGDGSLISDTFTIEIE